MYISTTLKSKQTFQATNPKQSNPQSSLSHKFKLSDTVYSFNVKPIKMLSDPVAEAFGLIHRHPSGENFCNDQEASHTAMRMPNTTNSTISEMAIVGQPLFAGLKAIDFGGDLLIFQEKLERCGVYQYMQFHVVK